MPLELLTGAISVLTGAIVYLWRTMHTRAVATEEKLETRWLECERKHDQTKKDLLIVSGKVDHFQGLMEGYSQAKMDLETMVKPPPTFSINHPAKPK